MAVHFPRSLGAWVGAAAAGPFLARDLRVIAALPSSFSLLLQSTSLLLSLCNSMSVLGTQKMAQNPSSMYWMLVEVLQSPKKWLVRVLVKFLCAVA